MVPGDGVEGPFSRQRSHRLSFLISFWSLDSVPWDHYYSLYENDQLERERPSGLREQRL